MEAEVQQKHRVEGAWLLVGVERSVERKIFVKRVKDSTAETLLAVISSHVFSGSLVYTDMFKSYVNMTESLQLVHFTVNHSKTFKDPDTGVHTNTVEGTNCAIKRFIPVRSRFVNEIDSHLGEFIWRRKHNVNLWDSFMATIRDVHYEFNQ